MRELLMSLLEENSEFVLDDSNVLRLINKIFASFYASVDGALDLERRNHGEIEPDSFEVRVSDFQVEAFCLVFDTLVSHPRQTLLDEEH